MKKIVISGINLFEGGPLSVYHDCLSGIISEKINEKYEIILFIHKKVIFSQYIGIKNFQFKELPFSRKNYLIRLWYEYVYFYFYTLFNKIDIWLSIHDISPNIKVKHRYVYCHNASPFYQMTSFERKHSPRLMLFNIFYKYLYRINIKKNDLIIVQQSWLKEKFRKLYGVNQVIVSHPYFDGKSLMNNLTINNYNDKQNIFFFPSFPRVFKNFEIVCDASKILAEKGIMNFKVILTIDGTENEYTKEILSKYSEIENIEFIGLLNREDVFRYYNESSYLIFASKLESWGLPIIEYKLFNKPMILANLDYAKEALGNYDRVSFFNPYDPIELAKIMQKVINKEIIWDQNKSKVIPDAISWVELLRIILIKNEK